jgi:hypothetical protein
MLRYLYLSVNPHWTIATDGSGFAATVDVVVGLPSFTLIKSTTMVQIKARIVFVCIILFYDFQDVYDIRFVSEGRYI